MIQRHTVVPRHIWALIALLFGLFCFQGISEYLGASVRLGVVVDEHQTGVRILAIHDHSPAQKADVPTNSVLKAIDGHPVASISDIVPILKAAQSDSVILTLEKDGKTRNIPVTPGTRVNYRSLVLNLLMLVVYISIGIAAIKASSVDSRTRLLAWFSFAVALDITTYINISYWPGTQLVYTGSKQMLAVLQFALIFHLLSLIPKPAPWMKLHYMPAALYVTSLVFHLLFLLLGLGSVLPGSRLSELARFILNNNLSFISWGGIIFCILIFQYFRTSGLRERRQVLWILFSVVPWLLLQLSDLLVPNPSWVYSEWYALADKFTHLLFPVGVLAAIFSRNLLDLNDLLPRKFFYSLLAALLLSIPAIAFLEAGILISNKYTPGSGIWLSGLAMLALGYGFSPLRDQLIQVLEGRSWYKQHHLGRDLRQLAEELSDMNGLEEIERQLTSRLASLMRSQGVILHLGPDQPDTPARAGKTRQAPACWIGIENERICLEELELQHLETPLHLGRAGETNTLLQRLYQHGLELIIPLQLHGRHLGSLMLGRSLGGQRYSWRETELLNLFAQNISAKFANALLHSQLQFDELTGLYRRNAIMEKLERCISNFQENGQIFSIAMIDLDDFKMVNDRHGHIEGDRILKMAAAAASEMLSQEERLGRYGGEEFLLVMPKRDKEGAMWLCEHVRWALEELQKQDARATTASIGIAESREISDPHLAVPEQALELIALADRRLYMAKAKGKNRVIAHG
ncbi:diguanylate cyclase [Thiolapillus sp.]